MQMVGVTGFRGLWAFKLRGKLFFRSIDRYWRDQYFS